MIIIWPLEGNQTFFIWKTISFKLGKSFLSGQQYDVIFMNLVTLDFCIKSLYMDAWYSLNILGQMVWSKTNTYFFRNSTKKVGICEKLKKGTMCTDKQLTHPSAIFRFWKQFFSFTVVMFYRRCSRLAYCIHMPLYKQKQVTTCLE